MTDSEPTDLWPGRVAEFFESHTQRIFKPREIADLISKNRATWQVPAAANVEAIVSAGRLSKIKLNFPNRPETRYFLGRVSMYEIASTVRPNCYLSHHTAMYLHKLTDGEPPAIYVNSEQTKKPRSDSNLDQDNIDWAFESRPRISSNTAVYHDKTVYLLSGKCSHNLGVVTRTEQFASPIPITTVERTLIDATVRPSYSGGIQAVLQAYRRAMGIVSVASMAKILEELDYVYPYHQSIGFLLEHAGVYSSEEIDLFRRKQMDFDFYLDYAMHDPKYSDRWRIYYPHELNAD